MTNEPDMEAPVTRRELHEALDIWGGALIARMDQRLEQRLEEQLRVQTAEIRLQLAEVVKVLREELRRHSNANKEDLQTGIAAVDEVQRSAAARAQARGEGVPEAVR